MKNVILVVFILLVVSVAGYFLYQKQKKDTKDKEQDKLPVVPPVVPTVAPPAPATATPETLSPLFGTGKMAVDALVSKIVQNPGEIDQAILDAGISQTEIYQGVNPTIFADRLSGAGISLPLLLSAEKIAILKEGALIRYKEGQLWQNVAAVTNNAYKFEDKTGVLLLQGMAKKDNNEFLNAFPCALQNCKNNDKKRNEEVQKNGTLKEVIESYVRLCSNYLEVNKKAQQAITDYAVRKLVIAGWNFPGYV